MPPAPPFPTRPVAGALVGAIAAWAFSSPSSAFAWGDLGHQTVAEIAERSLDPRARAFVTGLLGAEPLAVAAVFPDQVRADPRHVAFTEYHFVEIPPGTTYATKPARVARDAYAMLSRAPTLLRDPRVPRETRMILLRYLIHVVGDVHQPLHVGNGLEQGGNLCEVRWRDPASGRVAMSNLHTVWDERLFDVIQAEHVRANPPAPGTKRVFGYPELTAWALRAPAPGMAEVAAAPLAWFAEAQALHVHVYPDGATLKDPALRPYCRRFDAVRQVILPGAFQAGRVPNLDDAYVRRSLSIAQRQLRLGGARLARLLNQLAVGSAGTDGGADFDRQILDQALRVTN